jgi:L-galactose dehydrogenase
VHHAYVNNGNRKVDAMEQVKLGITGLEVGVAGLGSGGSSRLGQGYGLPKADSVKVIKAALDMGITFFDTAAVYKTEKIVGEGLLGQRQNVVVSTKAQIIKPGSPALGNDMAPPSQIREGLESSLKKLQTDYVDIFHLHGVMPNQYGYCVEHLLPELIKMREEGKIRHIGITERFITDTDHTMLSKAVADDFWDVVMIGLNFLNPSARKSLFPSTHKKGIATLIMFAVRTALSRTSVLKELLQEMADNKLIDQTIASEPEPLKFLTDPGIAESIMDAAYRFCRFEPGTEVILTGTGNVDHLRQNVASICAPILPSETLIHLEAIFGHVDTVSGN